MQRQPEGLMSALLHHRADLQPALSSMQSPAESQADAFAASFPQTPSNQTSRAPSPLQHGSGMRPEAAHELDENLAQSLAYVSGNILGDIGDSDPLTYRASQILGNPSFSDSMIFSALPPAGSMHFPDQSFRGQSAAPAGDGTHAQEDNINTSPSVSFKHAKISHGDSPGVPKSQRYACPYNKWDPEGCPLCCMPSNKNPGGGAETFSRVKSHILRNHDESVRCRRCWSSFVGKPEALKEHAKAGDCIYKARPKGYWMNESQTSYVRGQRFEGGGAEKWYHLFTVLLPHVKICDDQGNHLISPYYTPLSERGSEQAVLAALQADGKQSDFQPSTWPFSGQTSTMGSLCVQYENASLRSSSCASPIVLEDLLSANASFPSLESSTHNGPSMTLSPDPGPMPSFLSTSAPRPIPMRGSHRIDGRLDEACDSFNTIKAPASMPHLHSKRLSNNFLGYDNERLRRDNRQLRQERNDLQRRIDAVRANIDPLNQMIEAALYQNGIPLEVSTKLFAATETLNNLRQALG
ncbi:unnamed protein product [Clonostachys rhizophaga]|uniref:Uncharacterized protein n=1 Tax=Clonostachys rhizophaga TaxID=160324 RepID=A0A9N9YKA1_9HYPO|nr:unnamed protein product [Clonostachys rhizophaga]